jgi:hypothetical protein
VIEKPILLTGPMVNAIIAGNKTLTPELKNRLINALENACDDYQESVDEVTDRYAGYPHRIAQHSNHALLEKAKCEKLIQELKDLK